MFQPKQMSRLIVPIVASTATSTAVSSPDSFSQPYPSFRHCISQPPVSGIPPPEPCRHLFLQYNEDVTRYPSKVSAGLNFLGWLIYNHSYDSTRVAPSKTYDSLTEDFSYVLLVITIVALFIAIFVTWVFSERKEL